jgi:hypothetical protein
MDAEDINHLRNFESALGGPSEEILNYPYMCDQVPTGQVAEQEVQFADKIK